MRCEIPLEVSYPHSAKNFRLGPHSLETRDKLLPLLLVPSMSEQFLIGFYSTIDRVLPGLQ